MADASQEIAPFPSRLVVVSISSFHLRYLNLFSPSYTQIRCDERSRALASCIMYLWTTCSIIERSASPSMQYVWSKVQVSQFRKKKPKHIMVIPCEMADNLFPTRTLRSMFKHSLPLGKPR